MSKWRELAEIFNVEMGDTFKLLKGKMVKGEATITESGLSCKQMLPVGVLWGLFSGELVIHREPFQPKYNEIYWYVSPKGKIQYRNYAGSIFDIGTAVTGNRFRSSSGAEENREEILRRMEEYK